MQLFKNRIFLGVMSIAMAIIIGFIMVPVIGAATSSTTQVVRVNRDIAVGEKLTEENTVMVEVGKLNLPENVAYTQSDVIGLYATTDMQAGDMITASKVTQRLILPANKIRAMKSGESYVPIQLNSSSNLTRFLPNDIVSVYAKNDAGTYEIVPELRYLSVVTTTTADGVDILTSNQTGPNGERLQASSITFILTQAQTVKLLSSSDIRIMLTYRGNNDSVIEQYLAMQRAYTPLTGSTTNNPTSTDEG